MKKQYAVLGLGSFGESIALSLQRLGREVIVVDNQMETIEDIVNEVSYAMKADFSEPEVIRTIGARNLDGVIIAVSDDMEASVMATLVSKEIGVPYVMAKAKNEIHAKILKKIGADAVILPEKEMGAQIAKKLMSSNFADWIALSEEYSIVESIVPKDWIGKSLAQLDVRRTYGVNVVGIKVGEQVEVTPDPERLLQEGMVIILVGANADLEKI